MHYGVNHGGDNWRPARVMYLLKRLLFVMMIHVPTLRGEYDHLDFYLDV
jgi:hypothetical protein